MLPLHKVENGLDAAQHAANYSRAAVQSLISAVETLECWRPRGWIFKAACRPQRSPCRPPTHGALTPCMALRKVMVSLRVHEIGLLVW